jgi:uncharacterized membrane-anchored protein
MRKFYGVACMLAALVLSGAALGQKAQKKPTLPPGYTEGPAFISLRNGDSKLELPKGFLYLDPKAAEKFFTATKQPPHPNLMGLIADPNSKVDWYSMITYGDFGHVDDAGANEALQHSDDLLEQLKRNTRDSYAKMPPGSPPAPTVVGWLQPPAYNSQTHTLLTSVVAQEAGESDQTVNFSTIILGRLGGITYTIVGSKHDAAFLQAKQAQLSSSVRFTPSHDYASWQPEDGKSDLGFAGLVTGGAAVAVAAKTGLLAKLGSYVVVLLLALKKAIILVIVAIGSVGRWISSKFKRQPSEPVLPGNDGPTNV